MRSELLVKKYTQGLVGALRDEREYAAVSRDLEDFRRLARGHAELARLLASPLVSARKRARVIKDILAVSGISGKASRFLLLLFDHDRFGLLDEIMKSLPVEWNEHRGAAVFEVSSAVPLAESQRKKLQAQLERRQKQPVHLIYRLDPSLGGGLSLRRGNVVYDASVSGRLARLREKISEG